MRLQTYRDESHSRHFDLVSGGEHPRSIDLVVILTSILLVVGAACGLIADWHRRSGPLGPLKFADRKIPAQPPHAHATAVEAPVVCDRHTVTRKAPSCERRVFGPAPHRPDLSRKRTGINGTLRRAIASSSPSA